MPQLVNRQFNSPIGLYSDQNIREVIARDSHLMANGAVGIDFNNPMVGKPGNLQNSAVLRMLEEEESRQRNGQYTGLSNGFHPQRQPAMWPPEGAATTTRRFNPYSNARITGTKRVAWPPPKEGTPEHLLEAEQPAAYAQDGPQPPSTNTKPPPPTTAPIAVATGTHTAPPSRPNYHEPLTVITNPPSVIQPVSTPITPGTPGNPARSQRWGSVQAPQPFSPASTVPVNTPPAFAPTTATPARNREVIIPIQREPSQSIPSAKAAPAAVERIIPIQLSYSGAVPVAKLAATAPAVFGTNPVPAVRSVPGGALSYNVVGTPRPGQEFVVPIQIAGQQQQQSPAQIQKPFSGLTGQQQNQPPLQPQHETNQPPAQAAPYYQPVKAPVEPPPTIITLRPTAPVSQAPAPIYTSQPATATLKGGKNLRGDKKWPPEDVRERMSAEEQARVDLARGPACRPRRAEKDYSGFFAQHALNSTYPGYKIPPGTQFYDHHPMM